jgi:hypothetical protein
LQALPPACGGHEFKLVLAYFLALSAADFDFDLDLPFDFLPLAALTVWLFFISAGDLAATGAEINARGMAIKAALMREVRSFFMGVCPKVKKGP